MPVAAAKRTKSRRSSGKWEITAASSGSLKNPCRALPVSDRCRIWGARERSFHVFTHNDRAIWGATAAILVDFAARLTSRDVIEAR